MKLVYTELVDALACEVDEVIVAGVFEVFGANHRPKVGGKRKRVDEHFKPCPRTGPSRGGLT